MRQNRLLLLALALLLTGSSIIIWYTIHTGHEESWSLYYHLSLELLSDVVIIFLFDLIIGERQKRSEQKTSLMRHLYSEEEEIRVLALDQLLEEELLEGAILNNVDFRTLNLKGRNFENITFFKCKFFGSQLENASFKHCNFKGTDFSGGNLTTSEFEDCYLDNCNFSGSFFEDSAISDCTFDSCNLDNSRFSRSNIFNSVFEKCSANAMVAREINIDVLSGKTFPINQLPTPS